jgi:nitrous oxidase accessory protein NosD
MKIRTLENDDVYLLSEILDKMEIELPSQTKIVKGVEVKKDTQEYGKEVLTLLIRKIYKAKNEINQLISNLAGLPVEDISKMKIKDTVEAFKQITKQEGFADFLKQNG